MYDNFLPDITPQVIEGTNANQLERNNKIKKQLEKDKDSILQDLNEKIGEHLGKSNELLMKEKLIVLKTQIRAMNALNYSMQLHKTYLTSTFPC